VVAMSTKVKWERHYYSNGQLHYEIPYVNDQRHGVVRDYYSNGQLRFETPYVNGQLHGVEKYWDKEGNLTQEILWANGKEIPVNNKLSRLVLLGVGEN